MRKFKVKHPNTLDRGLIKGLITPCARHLFAFCTMKEYRYFHLACSQLSNNKHANGGTIRWGTDRIQFNEALSLMSGLENIFVHHAYNFPTQSKKPYIIDCGANIGLAQLYWKERFGCFDGICFEADPIVFKTLQSNLSQWGCSTTSRPTAISNKEGKLTFTATDSDSGRVGQHGDETYSINSESLSKYLNRPVDLLKIDIEGSEYEVLDEILTKLDNVANIFIEFHRYAGEAQRWPEYLKILSDAGFILSIQAEVGRNDPWMKGKFETGKLVQTINVFGTRKSC